MARQPRLYITPSAELSAALEAVAVARGVPVSHVALDLLEGCKSGLRTIAYHLSEANRAEAKISSSFAASARGAPVRSAIGHAARSLVDRTKPVEEPAPMLDRAKPPTSPQPSPRSAPVVTAAALREDERQLAKMGITLNRSERLAIKAMERRERKQRG